ncbi:low molecular weight protein-tyrosine-phosphatase [Litorivivens sp.]|uniref:low molecular weight protein-tyrosine-phosphatase n=1 Tax=Litorivivens sp. TaxID=2020868 RepID=UPI003564A683
MSIGVLFVCLGNICRSPAAQGILEKKIEEAGLSEHIRVDSCGTAAFNVGKAPDTRSQEASLRAGYDISQQIARQICDDDYQHFDYIIAMDRINLTNVEAWAPKDFSGDIELFMNYCKHGGNAQIPDPYYKEAEAFDAVISTLEKAAQGLLTHIREKHGL